MAASRRTLISRTAAICLIGLFSAGAATGSNDRSQAGDAESRCNAIAGMARGSLEIGTAEFVPAGPFAAPGTGPAQAIDLPAHCRVRGMIARRIGAGEREYGIGFELRLPMDWNRRFLFQGGGGLDGVVLPAVGQVANSAGDPALVRGYAVASTDSGHSGSPIDASFGIDQQARVDYGYNALDKVTQAAKRIIAEFYSGDPDYSYFLGCSNGGRQAMVASQRLPLEFDGIVAGDPAMGFSRLAIGEVWNTHVVARISPKDSQGRPILSRAFSDGDLSLVRDGVLRQCDAKDGLADGMINDWQGCDFTPQQIACKPGQQGECLAPEKAAALADLFRGPLAPDGSHIYGPFNYDTGVASPAFRGMRLGTSETGEPNSADATLGLGQFKYLQLTPPEPDRGPFDPVDLAEALERTRHSAALVDGDSPLLSTFARHGKMIVYNGLSDQGMASNVIVDWYRKMLDATGTQGAGAVRMFFVPGMLHCGGGEATDKFEMLDAIVDWVEHGRAPDRIAAKGDAFPGVTRPLCPFPTVARYKGGDPNKAESFACEE